MRPYAASTQMMSPPDVEPISLTQAKAHLRVDGGDEDALIAMCVVAARERVEQETRRALIRQQWRAYVAGDFGGAACVELPRPRLTAGDAVVVEYRNAAGVWTVYTGAQVHAAREPALLWAQVAPGDIGSPVSEQDSVWRATYWTGYGEAPEAVPGPLRHAVLMLTAHLFERREMVISGTIITEIPKTLDWLVDPYRVPWMGGTR